MRNSTKKEETPRGRGRPKAYDRETALKAMRDAFWNKGFAATSLDDLCAVTHMNRPSLYKAFGDKTQIFREVLNHYISYLRRRYIEAFDVKLPLRKSLFHVYNTALKIYLEEHEKPLGCLMMNVALTDTIIDPQIAEVIHKAMDDLRMGFRKRLKLAQETHELASDANIEALTVLVSSMHSALSVMVRAGESYENLCTYVRNGLSLIPAMKKSAQALQ